MRLSSIVRLPFVVAIATVATLYGPAPVLAASASNARVTCSSLFGVGDAQDPASVTGCTDAAKTGGRGKLVDSSSGGIVDVWTFTWTGKHGTTIARITERPAKTKFACPKGWIPVIISGTVTGGTGSAHTVIPNGQTLSGQGCADLKTQSGRLAKGTKLTL